MPRLGATMFVLASLSILAFAQEPAPPDLHPRVGPDHVDLGADLAIDLPAGYFLFEKAEARKLSEENGNFDNDNLVAMVAADGSDWLVEIEYYGDGYVSDQDASSLHPADLLKSYQDGTEAGNDERKQHGFGALHVDGWTDEPHYDAPAHRLTWGLVAHGDNGKNVNYFTRMLGRRGYASLDLIATPEDLATARADTDALLLATAFAAGSRYEDFDEKTDKVAEYGIAALVLGGAGAVAVKTGLIAKLIALALAGKKVILLGLAAIAAWGRKILGIKPKEEEKASE